MHSANPRFRLLRHLRRSGFIWKVAHTNPTIGYGYIGFHSFRTSNKGERNSLRSPTPRIDSSRGPKYLNYCPAYFAVRANRKEARP